MKRYISYILILIIVLSLLIEGCTQKGKGSKESIKTIKFATFYTDKEQGSIYKEIAKDFEQKNKDIKIKVVTDFGNEEKIKQALTGSAQYDILGLKRNQIIEFAKTGLLTDMSNIISENGLDKKLYKISLVYGSYNGKNYGIGDLPMTMEWFYNSDMFKKNKLKEPSNLKELIGVCKKLKAKKVIPIGLGAIDGWALTSFFGMITAQTTGIKELTSNYGSDTAAFKKISTLNGAFDIFGKLTGTCILRNSEEINYKQSVQDFVNGKVGILPAGSWATGLIDKIKPSGFKYNVFANGVYMNNSPVSVYSATGGQVISIPSNSKNSKEVQKFITYLFSNDVQRKFLEKGYTSSLILANTPENDIKKTILNHIGAADENSIMIMDNLEPTMLESLTMVLKDVLGVRVKPKDAWGRVIKLTFQR